MNDMNPNNDITSLSTLYNVSLDTIEATKESIADPDLSSKLDQLIGISATLLQMMVDKQEKSLSNRIKKAMGYMENKFQELGTMLGTGAAALKSSFEKLFTKIGEYGKMISDKAKELGSNISQKAGEFKQYVSGKMDELAGHVTTFYRETLEPTISKASQAAKDSFNKAVETIKPHMQAAAEGVSNKVMMARGIVQENVGKGLKAIGQQLVDSGIQSESKGQAKRSAVKRKRNGPKQI